jgi:hypothetical protein
LVQFHSEIMLAYIRTKVSRQIVLVLAIYPYIHETERQLV